MSEHNKTNGKAEANGHEGTGGDMIHMITAHIEHLMDIFEIGIAIIVAFGFIVSVYPLMRELPLLGSMSTGTTSYRHFLESALDLVIGIEFIKMLIKHTPGSVVEVLLFALSRHMVLEGGNALENLLTVCAIAIIFAIRRFLFIESFEFLTEKNNGQDWLSDWKEIKKGGAEPKKGKKSDSEKPELRKKKSAAVPEKGTLEAAALKKAEAKEAMQETAKEAAKAPVEE